MTDKVLHNVVVPEDTQTRDKTKLQRQVAALSALQSDASSVEATGAEPGTRRIDATYRGKYAGKVAAELEELAASTGYDVVAFYGQGQQTPDDGFYTTRSRQRTPPDPRDNKAQEVTIRVTKAGTRRSHWRAVTTAPDDVTNPFSSSTDENIAAPHRAEKVRWWNRTDGSLESATVQTTREGESARVDVYDATEPTFDSPTLIYDVPYQRESLSAVVAWDDRDRPKVEQTATSVNKVNRSFVGTATVGSTVGASERVDPAWQKVYRTDHEEQGTLWFDNGLLRLQFDEDHPSLRVYSWDATEGFWTQTALGSSSWRLFDADITRLSPVRADAQLEFEDKNNLGTTYNLNATLYRGRDTVQFAKPPNESGSTPSDLQTRLSPVAGGHDRDPGNERGIVKRSEVNR